ncbi:hypothetical protein EVA_20294 [gut metagenome]|uniref:Uncharacterized protein n=1 Tax=gut metagenome TaxID=749906 RepID=J9FAZ6_9ZZZZ
MVTAMIFFRSNFKKSKALAVTNNARVESKPPEIPRTAVLQWVCSSRFFNPMA